MDLTNEQWAVLDPLIPLPAHRGTTFPIATRLIRRAIGDSSKWSDQG
jgi:hypothetical protein